MAGYFDRPDILGKPPTIRAAYSDRTAWIMAEICRLVYQPLPAERSVVQLVDEIRQAVRDGREDDELAGLIRRGLEAGTGTGAEIESVLQRAGFELVDAFAHEGTEGVIVKLDPTRDFSGMLVVAFRGTQPSIADVVTDLKAMLVPARTSGRVHDGFMEAFERVESRIADVIKRHRKTPVYFTGHSLGGALAMIATRYLDSDSTGATYTFGCPRVADDTFYRHVKTPVYRIVNAADGVARVPFGYGLTIFLSLLRFIPINGTLGISEWIRKRFRGYTHYGHLVFLRPTAAGGSGKGSRDPALIVKWSPSIFRRVTIVVLRWIATGGRALASDHSIDQYVLKLGEYAEWRNRERR